MNNKIVHNVQIVQPDAILPASTVWIRNGIIEKIENNHTPLSPLPEEEYELIDGNGQWLIPGMIDVHIHGANGFDMMDGSEASIQEVSRACAATGCTSFLATSVSSTMDELLAMVRSVKRVVGFEVGAKIAGLHLEGPYLNPKRKGMQMKSIYVIRILVR